MITGKMSPAQVIAVELLLEQGYKVGDIFSPYDAFPERDNVDNGRRRAINGMCRKGFMTRIWKPSGHVQITERTMQLYEAAGGKTPEAG